MWGLKPNRLLILDDSLNLKGLKVRPENEIFAVIFNNFKGFDLKSNPFKNINYSIYYYKIWTITYSNFDFYDKKVSVNTACNEKLLYSMPSENLFSGNFLDLEQGTKFSQNTCPIIFNNIKLDSICINRISSSLIETNLLRFQNLSENLMKNINSKIFLCKIKIYHTEIDSNIFNKYIYSKTISLDLNGQITKIEEKTFKSFNNLRIIRFRMQNIQQVLVRNNKWLNYVNYDVNIDIKNSSQVYENRRKVVILVLYQAFYNLTFYDYPQSDLCYFKDFPHNRLVMPKLKPNYKTSCSCTEMFLIQNSALYQQFLDQIIGSVPRSYYLSQYYQDFLTDNEFTHCIDDSFLKRIFLCNFEETLKLCNPKQTEKPKKEETYFYINDWSLFAEYSEVILSLYMNPLFSFIAILLSILILVILSSEKIPKEMNKMYTYLKIYIVLNIVFTIIRLFKLIDRCSIEDLICVTIHSKSEKIQYFKIIFIRIIGNIFQSASNLTHITYTLSRYISVSNSKSCLNFIHKISFVKYLVGILMFSFIINIHIYFEYSIFKETSEANQLKSFDLTKTDMYKQEPFDDYKENFTKSEYLILDILQYIKIIFSDLFYILISFLIDLILLLFVKKSISKKEKITVSFVANINKVALDMNRMQNNGISEKQKKKDSLKNRITLMIVLNGFNFILLRLPLAISSFYGFISRYDNQEKVYKPNLFTYLICRYFRFCLSLNGFFYFMYLNSFIIQFFIILKLDKNFKNIFKSCIFSRKSCIVLK